MFEWPDRHSTSQGCSRFREGRSALPRASSTRSLQVSCWGSRGTGLASEVIDDTEPSKSRVRSVVGREHCSFVSHARQPATMLSAESVRGWPRGSSQSIPMVLRWVLCVMLPAGIHRLLTPRYGIPAIHPPILRLHDDQIAMSEMVICKAGSREGNTQWLRSFPGAWLHSPSGDPSASSPELTKILPSPAGAGPSVGGCGAGCGGR